MIISFLMVGSAGALWLNNEIENSQLEDKSYSVVSEIEKIFDEYIAHKNDENFEKIDKLEIDGTTYIGVLTIPSLDNLSLGVIGDYSMANLRISVCRYAGGIGKNKMIIAGHNYKYSFGKLSDMTVGSTAYFKTIDGVLYTYKCTDILVIEPNDIEKMKEGDWDMTLFTCTYGGQKRLTLRFELESVMSI